jgi:hypothetical protein
MLPPERFHTIKTRTGHSGLPAPGMHHAHSVALSKGSRNGPTASQVQRRLDFGRDFNAADHGNNRLTVPLAVCLGTSRCPIRLPQGSLRTSKDARLTIQDMGDRSGWACWKSQRDLWLRRSATSLALILAGSLPKRPVT